MTLKIAFSEFQDKLSKRTINPESLELYIEWDEDSPDQSLRFRSDIFLDPIPTSFDINEEIYQYLRDLDDMSDSNFEALEFRSKPRVVAEGDSWYNLPFFFRPFAIADWMKENKRLRVKNIARWGHTLAQILDQNEYIQAIEKYKPQFFMIGGGGNDIKNSLARGDFFHSYSADRAIGDYLTDTGKDLIKFVGSGLLHIMEDVNENYPNLPIYIHGYDYPRPWVGKGKYIGRYLRQLNIPEEMWDDLMHHKIDLLNTEVEKASSKVATATYINCRNITERFAWYDDLHPTAPGFKALSLRFEKEMGIVVDT